jgi:phage recombination protein Bet
MGRRFVDVRWIEKRMKRKDDRVNRALAKLREGAAMADRLTLATTPGAPAVTPDEVAVIRATIAKDATPEELKLFFYDCARQGVHPLDRLIHFTKRSGKYTPVTSIDFLRTRAAESGECAGIDEPVFTGTPKSPHFAATVSVYRLVHGQRYPFTACARWAEYVPDQAFMWQKMPHTMLGKCAEALALRKAFPKQLAGLYTHDELEQAEKPDPAPRMSKSLTPSPGPTPIVPDTGAVSVEPAAAPADHNEQIPSAWVPFLTDPLPHPPIRGHIVEGRRSKGGTKITAVLDTGEQVVTLDPEIGAQVISLKAANALVEITARVTGVGTEITSITEVDDPAF